LAQVKGMLPGTMSLEEASAGFRNQGQFIAALNAARNKGIDFVQLKDAMTLDGLSLGQAAKQVRNAPPVAPTTGTTGTGTTGTGTTGTGTTGTGTTGTGTTGTGTTGTGTTGTGTTGTGSTSGSGTTSGSTSGTTSQAAK
jgi:hypothetical protein